jgi:hypothetical protein
LHKINEAINVKKPKKVTARAALWLMQESGESGEIVETLAPTESERADKAGGRGDEY